MVPGERFELVTNCVLSAAPLPVGLTGYMDRGSGVEPDIAGFASQPLADQDATGELVTEETITTRGESPQKRAVQSSAEE